MGFLIILWAMNFIKAELYRRPLTHGVHPHGAVSDRNGGQQSCQYSQEWFSERRSPKHYSKCRHRGHRTFAFARLCAALAWFEPSLIRWVMSLGHSRLDPSAFVVGF